MKKSELEQKTARREFLGAVAAGAAAFGLAALPISANASPFQSTENAVTDESNPDEWLMA